MLILRPATMLDSQTLFEWRNDPLTRANSFNSAEVALKDHLAWLEKSISNPNRLLLIAKENGISVGTARLDRGENESEVSWTIAPSHRGKGIGKRMIKTLIASLSGEKLVAKIKPTNSASRKIAIDAGFQLKSTSEDEEIWIIQI